MMKQTIRLAAMGALLLFVAACANQHQSAVGGVPFTPGKTKIAMMPLDVNLFLLTAGGVQEPRADWTEQARGHVAVAIAKLQQERGMQVVRFSEAELSPAEERSLGQVVKLHRLVGNEILVQQRVPALRPPSKEGTFEWSIGTKARLVRDKTGARYGLFVSMKDSYSSGGRVALSIVTAVLFGFVPGGGTQVGYASLVDLDTGNVVWFGSLARGAGDLRTAESAQSAINDLFSGFPKQ